MGLAFIFKESDITILKLALKYFYSEHKAKYDHCVQKNETQERIEKFQLFTEKAKEVFYLLNPQKNEEILDENLYNLKTKRLRGTFS